MSIDTCWHLARYWYAGRAERDWQRPGQKKTQDMFNNLGLTGSFWDLE